MEEFQLVILAALNKYKNMQSNTVILLPIQAKQGLGSGFAAIIPQNSRIILEKNSGILSGLVTLQQFFAGVALAGDHLLKMVLNGE